MIVAQGHDVASTWRKSGFLYPTAWLEFVQLPSRPWIPYDGPGAAQAQDEPTAYRKQDAPPSASMIEGK
jgi:hypothetical protein